MGLEQALQEYADKFKDNFPIFYVNHLDEDEMVKLIKKCIKDGKPYEADYGEGVY